MIDSHRMIRRHESFFVPHAAMRPRQVGMLRRPGAQIVVDLPPIHAGHVAGKIEDREHDGAVHVLVAALGAQNAETLQASTKIGSGLAVLVRQRESQFAICKTQLEVADHLRVCEAAAFEIAQCFRRVP
jgi:hypothetical protein